MESGSWTGAVVGGMAFMKSARRVWARVVELLRIPCFGRHVPVAMLLYYKINCNIYQFTERGLRLLPCRSESELWQQRSPRKNMPMKW